MNVTARCLLAGTVGVLGTLWPLAPASAVVTEEQVADLVVVAEVAADSSVTLSETITYDFGNTVQHGIYRDIPVTEDLVTGDVRHYGVDVLSVRMDGGRVPYEIQDQGPSLRVRIGDPDGAVMDIHEYEVVYRVTGALRPLTADDAEMVGANPGDAELYWNFVGTGWEVPVAVARATVSGPAEPMAVECFMGEYGSVGRCEVRASGSTVAFGPVSLAPRGALTGAVVWPSTAFDRPVVQDIREGPTALAARGALLGVAAGVVVAVILIGLALALRRRDVGVPVGAPPMYGPPCGLAPAEMSAAITGVGFPATSLLATLLDLAARGWVHMNVDGEDVVRLRRQKPGGDRLRDWERELMDAVFEGRKTASLDRAPIGLPITMSAIGMGLVDVAVAQGYRNPDGGRPDRRWAWVGAGGVVLTTVSLAWLLVGGAAPVPAALSVVGAFMAVGSIAAAVITPRTQTPTSARFLSEVAGLTKVLGTDSAQSRQVFAQESGLAPAAILVTMLPYAVALGLEDAWIAAFPDLSPDELSATGLGISQASMLSAFVAAGLRSAMTASTYAPTSTGPSTAPDGPLSGGSGLSGRGYAGGGGGGGGGGGW